MRLFRQDTAGLIIRNTLIVSSIIFTQCEKEKNYARIKDGNFLNALIEQGVDKNNDGLISKDEAAVVYTLNVSDKGIACLEGIEAFINLRYLYSSGNYLTSLDVSNSTSLTKLECGSNQLTSLDVSNNTQLEGLFCESNQLTSLDVSNNSYLTTLYCASNQLTVLDVSNTILLTTLFCESNQLTSLDVSNNRLLANLYCASNQLTILWLGYISILRTLSCGSNQLTNLDISNHRWLRRLHCASNQLTNLDISNNPNITVLELSTMPSLMEVCVWTTPFPPEGVDVDTTGSPNVYFTMDCIMK